MLRLEPRTVVAIVTAHPPFATLSTSGIMYSMMSGFSEQWQCEAGEWIVWTPDAATKEAMQNAPDLNVCTSFVQADHLRSGIDGEACTRRLVFTAFMIE